MRLLGRWSGAALAALIVASAVVLSGFFDYSSTPGNIGGIPVCTSAPADLSYLVYTVSNGNWCGSNASVTKKITINNPAGSTPGLLVIAPSAGSEAIDAEVTGDANPRERFVPGTGLQVGTGAAAPTTVIDESKNGTLASLTLTTPLAALQGGTGKSTGAASVFSCLIPDTSTTTDQYCPFAFTNTATQKLFVDELVVRYNAACTTFPVVALVNVTRAATVINATALNGTAVAAGNAYDGTAGAAAGDTYAFETTTAPSACGATLNTEFVYATVTVRN